MAPPECEDDRFNSLREEFPDAPSAELLRFCRARPNSSTEAAEMYQKHLEWRQGAGTKANLEQAAKAVPPNYIRQAGLALDGTPILFVQGARYDEEVDPEQYMLACCHALDTMLPPDDGRKCTILIDARPGEGWHNASAHKMLPFFRLACGQMPDNFPERVQRVILYPIPMIVKQLWVMVRGLLDKVTRDKFEILSGAATINAPCPAKLREVVLLDQLPKDAHEMHQALIACDDVLLAPDK